jgi:hypothetical protein
MLNPSLPSGTATKLYIHFINTRALNSHPEDMELDPQPEMCPDPSA